LGGSAPSPRGYDKRTIAQELHALLVANGHPRATLVAHDIGAAVAYSYAKQFPEGVDKLVLMDDPLPGLKDWNDVRGKWPRWHFAFNALRDLPEQLVSGKEYEYLSWFYRNAFQKGAITEDDARIYAASYANPSSLHAGFEYYRAFEADAVDNAADASVLHMPTLVLGGDHSPWGTFLAEQLEGRATALHRDVALECGHFIPEEQPAWLVTRLETFFAGDGSSPP
jgi:pimeloyl-ACP methyl ester carboxylesterase